MHHKKLSSLHKILLQNHILWKEIQKKNWESNFAGLNGGWEERDHLTLFTVKIKQGSAATPDLSSKFEIKSRAYNDVWIEVLKKKS